MKKLLLIILLALAFVVPATADEIMDDDGEMIVPPKTFTGIMDKVNWRQGIAFSTQENKINYLSTVELLRFEKYVKGLTIEAGYAGDGNDSDHKLVGVVSYPLVNFKEMGVTIPILDLVEANIGAWFGAGHLNRNIMNTRSDYGVSLSLLNLKF